MIETNVFDAMGCLTDEYSKPLNKYLFEHPKEAGYSNEDIERWKDMQIQKDPKFYFETEDPKIELLKSGVVKVMLYSDVKPAFKKMKDENMGIRVFSKGALGVLNFVFQQKGLLDIINESQVTSSLKFQTSDKNKPACYEELFEYMQQQFNETIRTYFSDSVYETNACYEALKSVLEYPVYLVNRGQEILIKPASGVEVIDGLHNLI